MSVIRAFVLPGLPQPLLVPHLNAGYQRLKNAFIEVKNQIEQSDADVILIYSTMWPSVIGHQIQARPEPEWTHVDEEFHDLGEIHYKLRIDSEFAKAYVEESKSRGLQCRAVDYKGFPIDTGSVVALKLINPNNRLPAVIVSSNVYADRAETMVLAKAAVETLKKQNKKAIAIIISTLSNRLHQTFIDPKDDVVHSLKDQEWNTKILEFLEKGRLEDVAQLSRQIHREARVKKVSNFKPFWWLSGVAGSHNRYTGEVLAYEPVCGAGCAVVGLTPAPQAARDLEFDEESPDVYVGDRNVLAPSLESLGEMSSHMQKSTHEDDMM